MKVKLLMQCYINKDGNITLGCTTGNDEESKSFFAATPSGRLEFNTVNQLAAEQFEVGKQYYLTLEAK